MAIRLFCNLLTGFAVFFAIMYVVANRTGYSEWLDPLFGLGAGLLCFRYGLRRTAIIPWAYAVMQAAAAFQIDLSGAAVAVALMSIGYVLLLNPLPPMPSDVRQARFGNVRLQPSEVGTMQFVRGIGDIRLDLSQAIIPQGEHSIRIDRLLGNVTIYIPYDLDVSVHAAAYAGRLEALNQLPQGFPKHIDCSTAAYLHANAKLRIIVSTVIGDVSVRYI